MPNSMLPQQHIWKVTLLDIQGKPRRFLLLRPTYEDAHAWAKKRAAALHADIEAVANIGPLTEDT